MKSVFLVVAVYAAFVGLSFLLTSGVVKVICWAFSLAFTWKFALGVWLILLLVSLTLGKSGNK